MFGIEAVIFLREIRIARGDMGEFVHDRCFVPRGKKHQSEHERQKQARYSIGHESSRHNIIIYQRFMVCMVLINAPFRVKFGTV